MAFGFQLKVFPSGLFVPYILGSFLKASIIHRSDAHPLSLHCLLFFSSIYPCLQLSSCLMCDFFCSEHSVLHCLQLTLSGCCCISHSHRFFPKANSHLTLHLSVGLLASWGPFSQMPLHLSQNPCNCSYGPKSPHVLYWSL